MDHLMGLLAIEKETSLKFININKFKGEYINKLKRKRNVCRENPAQFQVYSKASQSQISLQ